VLLNPDNLFVADPITRRVIKTGKKGAQKYKKNMNCTTYMQNYFSITGYLTDCKTGTGWRKVMCNGVYGKIPCKLMLRDCRFFSQFCIFLWEL
jgi:hypothetical protein